MQFYCKELRHFSQWHCTVQILNVLLLHLLRITLSFAITECPNQPTPPPQKKKKKKTIFFASNFWSKHKPHFQKTTAPESSCWMSEWSSFLFLFPHRQKKMTLMHTLRNSAIIRKDTLSLFSVYQMASLCAFSILFQQRFSKALYIVQLPVKRYY